MANQVLINKTTLSSLGDAARSMNGEEKYLPNFESYTKNWNGKNFNNGSETSKTVEYFVPEEGGKIHVVLKTAGYNGVYYGKTTFSYGTSADNIISSTTYTSSFDTYTFDFDETIKYFKVVFTARVASAYGYYIMIKVDGVQGEINPDAQHTPTEIVDAINNYDCGVNPFIDAGTLYCYFKKDGIETKYLKLAPFLYRCLQKTTKPCNDIERMFAGSSYGDYIRLLPKNEVANIQLSGSIYAVSVFDNSNYWYSNGEDLIPTINSAFKFNFKEGSTIYSLNGFASNTGLLQLPQFLYDMKPYLKANTNNGTELTNAFHSMVALREFDWSFFDEYHDKEFSSYSNGRSVYYGNFDECYALREIRLPVYSRNDDTNGISHTFTPGQKCHALRHYTFRPTVQLQGVRWHGCTIDLTYNTGYGQYCYYGLKSTHKVTDDATYQQYKNEPDAWTALEDYSFYNHDSAVETINSLPDASEWIATGKTVNTIKFRGSQGAKTDGGAINTLTAEEIAVATEKGWTVTFV